MNAPTALIGDTDWLVVARCPSSIHPGDHIIVGGEEIVVDSDLSAIVDEAGLPGWEFDRHIIRRDTARLRGASDQYGVTRLSLNQVVQVCRRGGAA